MAVSASGAKRYKDTLQCRSLVAKLLVSSKLPSAIRMDKLLNSHVNGEIARAVADLVNHKYLTQMLRLVGVERIYEILMIARERCHHAKQHFLFEQRTKRPLNPFQRFYREERGRLLKIPLDEPEECLFSSSEKRKHERSDAHTHNISFEEMTKHVSLAWKQLNPIEKQQICIEQKALRTLFKRYANQMALSSSSGKTESKLCSQMKSKDAPHLLKKACTNKGPAIISLSSSVPCKSSNDHLFQESMGFSRDSAMRSTCFPTGPPRCDQMLVRRSARKSLLLATMVLDKYNRTKNSRRHDSDARHACEVLSSTEDLNKRNGGLHAMYYTFPPRFHNGVQENPDCRYWNTSSSISSVLRRCSDAYVSENPDSCHHSEKQRTITFTKEDSQNKELPLLMSLTEHGSSHIGKSSISTSMRSSSVRSPCENQERPSSIDESYGNNASSSSNECYHDEDTESVISDQTTHSMNDTTSSPFYMDEQNDKYLSLSFFDDVDDHSICHEKSLSPKSHQENEKGTDSKYNGCKPLSSLEPKDVANLETQLLIEIEQELSNKQVQNSRKNN